MNQRTALFAWVATVILIVIGAGLVWSSVELVASAGSQLVEITGYLTFPIINALVLLQTAAMLVGFLTPVIVSRFVSAFLVPIMGWHLVIVLSSKQTSLTSAIDLAVSELTGVVGGNSQAGLISTIDDSLGWVLYPIAVGLNIAVLAFKSIVNLPAKGSGASKSQNTEPEDLWDNQK